MPTRKDPAGEGGDEGPPPQGPAPLEALRADHRALLEAAHTVDGLLAHGVLGEPALREIEARLRDVRSLLARHPANEERALYPELERVDPALAVPLAEVRRLHAAAEDAFARLQAQFLAFAVEPSSVGARRRARRAAAEFLTAAAAAVEAAQAGPLASAERLLDAQALGRVRAAAEAAALHDALKAAQRR
jgi:hypothetical protein